MKNRRFMTSLSFDWRFIVVDVCTYLFVCLPVSVSAFTLYVCNVFCLCFCFVIMFIMISVDLLHCRLFLYFFQ